MNLRVAAGLAALAQAGAAGNDRPVIGILTQPLNVEYTGLDFGVGAANTTYIAASYVKFAESAGSRVVPLHFDSSDAELTETFKHINGIIFPGGGADIANEPGNRHRQAANLLYKLAVEANKAGETFPIHGTCLGFEMLSLIAAEDDGVLCGRCYTTEGTPLPLNFTAAARTSHLFSGMSADLRKAVSAEKLTENSHRSGLDPIEFKKSQKLRDVFTILSTNTDPNNGRLFVSSMESHKYPFSATQWHPEKNNFEWGKIGNKYAAIPHSENAVLLSQYMANNFIARARRNSHQFPSEGSLKAALIYNTVPRTDPQGYFEQVYLWPRKESQQEDHKAVIV